MYVDKYFIFILKNLKIFDLFKYKLVSPYSESEKKSFDFFVFQSVDWINILPITKDGKVVFVEQYRPGTDSITLELPGGMSNEDEEPIESAKRELKEETGFSMGQWLSLPMLILGMFMYFNETSINNND